MKLQVALLVILVQLIGESLILYRDLWTYYKFIECRVKPRLDQTASFSDFFIKKWNRLARNEKLKEWDTSRTGKILSFLVSNRIH